MGFRWWDSRPRYREIDRKIKTMKVSTEVQFRRNTVRKLETTRIQLDAIDRRQLAASDLLLSRIEAIEALLWPGTSSSELRLEADRVLSLRRALSLPSSAKAPVNAQIEDVSLPPLQEDTD